MPAEVNGSGGQLTRVKRLIGRPRVFEKLGRDWPAPLLVVNAPAGFGKTTTIEAFLGGRSARTVWISLDEDDNDAVLLWSRILAEAHREYGIGHKAGAALGSAIASPRRAIEQLAAEARKLGEPLVIVLDDLHLIDDAVCLRSIELGVRLLTPEVSWILLTRQNPALPLERLNGRGELLRIGPEVLAFDQEETADLLSRFDLNFGRDERDAVHEATGGWPAAVYMSALWLRDAPDPKAAALELAPGDGELTDYLVHEVIGGLPPRLRTFLRRSAVLRRLNGALCDEVLQQVGSQEMIDQLRETSLLVRGERGRRGWYRYHALLRRALVAELEELEPGAAAPMQRRAAAWFLGEGLPEDAAELARDAGAYALLADLLADNHLMLMRGGRATTLLRWVEALPEDVLAERPDVAISAAMAAEVAARPSIEVRRLLGRADVARQREDPGWSVESEVEFQMLSAATGEGGVGASVAAARVAAELSVESVPQLSHVSEAVLGMFLDLAGEREEAEAISRKVVEDPTVVARPFALLFAKGTLALAELRRGRPKSAREQIERALATITRFAIEDATVASRIYACEALVAIAEGDAAAARRAAERALERPFDTAPMLAWTQLVAADARAFAGDFAGARAALEHAREMIERAPDAGRLVGELDAVTTRVAAAEAEGGVLAEPVSPAELRVLRLLAEDMTRAEIADSLVVSLNTVKTHQRSLYRKLGASDRETAIGRARSYGLLDRALAEDDSPG